MRGLLSRWGRRPPLLVQLLAALLAWLIVGTDVVPPRIGGQAQVRAQQLNTAPASTFASVTVTSTATSLSASLVNTPRGYATQCLLVVETAAIRYRYDGTAPTTTVGLPGNVADTIVLGNSQDIANFQHIAQTGSPVLQIACTTGTTPAPSTVVRGAVNGVNTVGAASSVLQGNGGGNAPTWTATPGVTSLAAANVYLGGASAGAGTAGSDNYFTKTVTGIADNVATNVLTVTVPNAAHAAVIPIVLLTSLGAGGTIGAFECSGTAYGQIVVARTAGLATVATAVALSNAGSSCVAGATTITTAYAVSSISGGNSATQTFTVTVTITKGAGSSANHQAIVAVDMVNANASGITIS
jgi:hypothetical protein